MSFLRKMFNKNEKPNRMGCQLLCNNFWPNVQMELNNHLQFEIILQMGIKTTQIQVICGLSTRKKNHHYFFWGHRSLLILGWGFCVFPVLTLSFSSWQGRSNYPQLFPSYRQGAQYLRRFGSTWLCWNITVSSPSGHLCELSLHLPSFSLCSL